MKPVVKRLVMLVCLGLLSACSGLTPKPLPPPSPEALRLLSVLEERNRQLKTFKGMGKVTLWKEDSRQIARLAWVGAAPERLRVSVLDVSGRPDGSFSGDGEYFYALSHSQNRLYKMRSSDPSLKRVIAIPIRSRAVIRLLTGRVPLQSYASAEVAEAPAHQGHILVLKNSRGRILERIYWNKEKTGVHKVEMFDSDGDFIYRAEFENFRTVKGYRIPFGLSISNETVRFQLRVDRYWADMPIPPSAFVLTAPET